MFHPSTQRLIDYWRSRKGAGLAPARADIDPTDFVTILPQVFILGRKAAGDYNFRLVGGFVGDLHRRDLRGLSFASLWAKETRHTLQAAMETARRRGEPVVVSAEVLAGPYAIGMEVLIAPLTNSAGQVDRFIGLYQPKSPVNHLRGLACQTLNVLSCHPLGEGANDEAPRIRLAAIAGRLVG